MILLAIVACAPLAGCGSSTIKQQAARIVELETYSQDLESRLTALKEKQLGEDRELCSGRPAEPPPPPAPEVSARTNTSVPADLPVVHLSPSGVTTSTSGESADESDPSDATAAQHAAGLPAGHETTRPVVKVHGSQEGQVYQRTLSAAERETAPSL